MATEELGHGMTGNPPRHSRDYVPHTRESSSSEDDDPDFYPDKPHRFSDTQVQWAAVAVILLFVGSLIIAAASQ